MSQPTFGTVVATLSGVQPINPTITERDPHAILLPPELIDDCEQLCESSFAARHSRDIDPVELSDVCRIIDDMGRTVELSRVPADRFDMSRVRGLADMLGHKWSLPDRMLRAALEMLECVCQRELERCERHTDIGFPPSSAIQG